MGNEASRADDLRLSPEEEAELEREMEEEMEEGSGAGGGNLTTHPHLVAGPNYLPGEPDEGPNETAQRWVSGPAAITPSYRCWLHPIEPLPPPHYYHRIADHRANRHH